MVPIQSLRPLAAVAISLAVVPVLIPARSASLREALTIAAAICKFVIIASMLRPVLVGVEYFYTIAQVAPGVAIRLRVDAMGLLFALVISQLWIATSAYSIGYMRGLKERNQGRYYSFFAVAISATIGVAFAANLFTLYLFYELLLFSAYPLVTHYQDAQAKSSGRKYLFYLAGGSIGLVLPAMSVCYSLAGTLDFSVGGILLKSGVSEAVLLCLLLMFVFGFAKAAIMPCHSWLPAAMVAPTPVSAFLHSVAVVGVGVFCIIRVLVEIFGPKLLAWNGLDTIVCYLAAATIVISSFIALSQDGLKRRLAFSTISQLAHIVLGAALLSPTGLIGSMTHIVTHAVGKITLFFCAGAVFVATGKRNISEMSGIGKQMPITMLAFFLGSLSVIGLPPSGGFVSKWYLILGTLDAGRLAMLVVLLLSSLLTAAYLLPVVYSAFFGVNTSASYDAGESIKEAPFWCTVPLALTASASVLLFFLSQPFVEMARLVANKLIG